MLVVPHRVDIFEYIVIQSHGHKQRSESSIAMSRKVSVLENGGWDVTDVFNHP